MSAWVLCLFLGVGLALGEEWQPIIGDSEPSHNSHVEIQDRSYQSSPNLRILNKRPSNYQQSGNELPGPLQGSNLESDSCSVYKVSMNQHIDSQLVEYEKSLPDLKEFTLCMWTKFHNHSSDHPLFSYADADSPKEILAWVSNSEQSSYFSLAVHGQTFFRLNYPLKLHTWYHTCQSWNGKTGEWQLWVNAERVGRGFHNRLVGHIINGGGSAISGQEQTTLQYKHNGLIQPGLMGELTMLQIYHVALTAGKAHKDHKHHHAHHFNHDGTQVEATAEPVTEPPPPVPQPIGNGNFLIGGQLQRAPNLNVAGAQQQQQMVPIQLPNGQLIQQEYLNGQFPIRIVSEQLLNSLPQNRIQAPFNRINPQVSSVPLKGTTVYLSGSLLNPANVQYIDDSKNFYKRDAIKRDKRDNPEKQIEEEERFKSGKKDKRGLIALSDGSIVDEALLSADLSDNEDDAMFQMSLLHGLAGVVGNIPIQNIQKSDDREPAEAEVKAVMLVCSGCSTEPFKKALVLSWRSTPKKLYNGAHYYKGLPICRAF